MQLKNIIQQDTFCFELAIDTIQAVKDNLSVPLSQIDSGSIWWHEDYFAKKHTFKEVTHNGYYMLMVDNGKELGDYILIQRLDDTSNTVFTTSTELCIKRPNVRCQDNTCTFIYSLSESYGKQDYLNIITFKEGIPFSIGGCIGYELQTSDDRFYSTVKIKNKEGRLIAYFTLKSKYLRKTTVSIPIDEIKEESSFKYFPEFIKKELTTEFRTMTTTKLQLCSFHLSR